MDIDPVTAERTRLELNIKRLKGEREADLLKIRGLKK